MNLSRRMRFVVGVACAMTACLAAPNADAAYSCTLSITAISTVYSPTVVTNNDSTGTYTISCVRTGASDATMTYTLRATNGNQPTGNTNRVQFGAAANRYSYEIYRDAAYSQEWRNNAATEISGTLNFGASSTATLTGLFYLRVFGNQPVDPAGTYTDAVTITLNPEGGGNNATATLNVTVITTNSCQINFPPTTMTFNYVALQAGPALASSSFGLRCTTGLPYTMTLDANNVTDNAVGLAYTLSITPPSGTGNGATQTRTINGTMAGGQAGKCSVGFCTNAASTNKTRTLTVTY